MIRQVTAAPVAHAVGERVDEGASGLVRCGKDYGLAGRKRCNGRQGPAAHSQGGPSRQVGSQTLPVAKGKIPNKAAHGRLPYVKIGRPFRALTAIRYLINTKTRLPRISYSLGEGVLDTEI